MKAMWLGIDLGGTKIAAGVVDDRGVVAGRIEEVVDQSSDSSVFEQLLKILGRFGNRPLNGVGIGIPGIADSSRGTVWAPNLRGWNHLPLQSALNQHYGAGVVLESDRNTALLGEALYGAAVGCRDVVFLILGTGIGAGILSGGRIVRGRHEIAGAVGWIPVGFQGGVSHFESVASGPAIARLARGAGLAGELPELVDQARQGNLRLKALFGAVGDAVGQVLSILVSSLNPELILVGGGVSNAWDILEPAAMKSMRSWSQPIAVENVRVVRSGLGPDAGIIGAAAAAAMAREAGPDSSSQG